MNGIFERSLKTKMKIWVPLLIEKKKKLESGVNIG